jgi:hypothetical protein
MTAEDIARLVAELGDIAEALQEGKPEHKLDLYRSPRLRLTCLAETQTVHATIYLGEHRWDFGPCPRIYTNQTPTASSGTIWALISTTDTNPNWTLSAPRRRAIDRLCAKRWLHRRQVLAEVVPCLPLATVAPTASLVACCCAITVGRQGS